ncbi:MAG: nucleotide exchange factor GrpE [Aureliella sp.]
MSRSDSSDQPRKAAGNQLDPGEAANAVDDINAGTDDYFNSDQRVAELAEKLKAAETEVLKSHAEVENFRKRLQRDADQQLRFANLPLVRDILDVMDNLKRATEAASGEAGNAAALLDGVKMVTQQLQNVLAKYACKPIEAVGQPFDPNVHQAITQMPSDEVPAGTVLQEVAVGYLLHDRVVRPSQVIVSTGPAR